MNWASVSAAIFMSSFFMLFLTDYAGIDQAIGKIGIAASIATSVLLVGQLLDAIDDPLQGWIMDSAKHGRLGKYKKFSLVSVILLLISMICIYGIPEAVKSNKVLLIGWIMLFYIMYEIGISFNAREPLKQSITNDLTLRAKLTTIPRIVDIVILFPFALFLSIATVVNQQVGNMTRTFSIMTAIMMGFVAIISIIGTLMIKEGKLNSDAIDKKDTYSLKTMFAMFKMNKPLIAHFFATFFQGFMWNLSFATALYFIKWAYCYNPLTGATDLPKLGIYVGILALMQSIPCILGAFLGQLLVNKIGDIIKAIKVTLLASCGFSLLLFLSKMIGFLDTMPALYFILLFGQILFLGIAFLPLSLIWLECIDFAEFKTGKKMGGIIMSTGNFQYKAQGALSSAAVGGLLITIGYSVDAVSGNFVGDPTTIPSMLNWFMVISALLPTIVGLISIAIYHFYYPITKEKRADILHKLAEQRGLEDSAAIETAKGS